MMISRKQSGFEEAVGSDDEFLVRKGAPITAGSDSDEVCGSGRGCPV